MKRTGEIKVDSGNIMPVIKKWLYSDKDIFLRELVSNASDAISKHKKLVSLGEAAPSEQPYRIEVVADEKAGTLSVRDNGIGMTAEETEKYISQVAFSGAEDFVQKYSAAGKDGIIGHFGLGFYSAYMVADKVEVQTQSYAPGSEPAVWESDGGTQYTVDKGSREGRGSTVILHLSEDEKEFLEQYRLSVLLRKYCAFMPYEIYLNPKGDKDDKPINNTQPLWLKDPKTVTDEEYEKFYSETFLDFEKPLFWIHLNVDYPFNLKGLLYFPRQNNPMEVRQGEVKLYCNQVYIADNIKEIIPEFLMLLKGTIDSPDIPLNVSRSFLQNDREVQKLSRHITKKVADKLTELFESDREKFTGFFPDIAPFIKFGCIKDESFFDKVKSILLFKDLEGSHHTLEELSTANIAQTDKPDTQQEKSDKAEDKKDEKNSAAPDQRKVYYVTDQTAQAGYIADFKKHGLNAVVLEHYIDPHFISFLEYKERGIKFLRIDSETPDALRTESTLGDTAGITELFAQNISDKSVKVMAGGFKGSALPAVMTVSEYSRRFSEMNSMMGAAAKDAQELTITLNTENAVVRGLESLPAELLKQVCEQIYDIAALSCKKLSPEGMTAFLERTSAQLEQVVSCGKQSE